MSELVRSIPSIAKIIQYALLSLLFAILLMGLIWIVLPSKETVYPPHAYDNSGDLGSSALKSSLASKYSIVQNKISLLELSYSPDSVLLLIQPERTYSTVELDYLQYLISQGQAVIILGVNSATTRLLNRFGYEVTPSPLYDYEQNYGSPSLLKASAFNGGPALLVKPSPVYFAGYSSSSRESYGAIPLVSTYDTAAMVDNPEFPFYGSFEVIFRDREYNLIVGADGWSFTNFALNIEPANAKLLMDLIEALGEFETVILEESAYAWISSSKSSALTVMSSFFLRIAINPWFVLIAWIGFPLLGVFRSGILKSKRYSSELGKRISQRLRDLHVRNTPLISLTLEEQFLTKHDLWQGYHRYSYFALVAGEFLKEFQETNLSGIIPQNLINALTLIQRKALPETVVWQILEDLAIALEIINKEGREKAKEIFQQLDQSWANNEALSGINNEFTFGNFEKQF